MLSTPMRKRLVALLLVSCTVVSAQIKRTSVPLGSALSEAIAKSSLTDNDPVPFHILILIKEPENPQSPYQASIEEWWVSKDQWRREVSDKEGLEQTIVVANGNKTEKDEGDYFPLWLRDFVTAAFDPIPNLDAFNRTGATIEQITMPNGAKSEPNVRFQSKIGTGDRATDAFSNISFDDKGRLSFYGSPRYSMEFHDYSNFHEKQYPRTFIDDPEPGTRLVGKVVTLQEESEVRSSANLFAPLPTTDDRFTSVTVSSLQLEQLTAESPIITWPPVRSGNTHGQLAIYIGVDNKGQVREAWPLNSDNAGLEDAVRDQVKKWKLKPAVDKTGNSVQIDGGLGFHFDTGIANPLPVLTSAEDIAKQTSGCAYKPMLAPGLLDSGKSFKIRISVNEQGKNTGESFPPGIPWNVIQSTGLDTVHCVFRPYLVNGQPTYYHIDFTFTAP
jgi:hypothetical protein